MPLDSYGGPIRNIRLFSLDVPAWVFPIIKEFLQVGFYEYMVNTVLNYVFFRLYLDALDEELLVLLASISDHVSAPAEPRAEGREVSQSSLTDVEKRGFVVRQLLHLSLRGAWHC